MTNIKELKKEIVEKLINIPSWIDTTNSLHYLIWNNGIIEINGELIKLISNTVLTEKSVFKIYTSISNSLDLISEVTNNDLQIKVITYYSRVLIYLEDVCIENENFESAANVKRFTDIYYNINIIPSND